MLTACGSSLSLSQSGHSALSLLISNYSRLRNDALFIDLCNRLIVAGANINHKTKEVCIKPNRILFLLIKLLI